MTRAQPRYADRCQADPPEILRFDDVSLRYPSGTTALTEVSLSVRKGEFVSVVGPSGCGKSTLLRIASGLCAPTSGTVTLAAADTGYVFQHPTLLPWRSIQANVELLTELAGADPAQRAARAASALELVGLSGVADHLPHTLSGGMQMRASLARSLTLHPDLFLFDEPFGALDEITRERLNSELLELFRDQQFGSLFITHSVAEAVYLSTRVVVMSGRPGRVVGEFDIGFDYPRDPELRFASGFARLCGDVSRALRQDHRGTC